MKAAPSSMEAASTAMETPAAESTSMKSAADTTLAASGKSSYCSAMIEAAKRP
jgi:hypothetical protein